MAHQVNLQYNQDFCHKQLGLLVIPRQTKEQKRSTIEDCLSFDAVSVSAVIVCRINCNLLSDSIGRDGTSFCPVSITTKYSTNLLKCSVILYVRCWTDHYRYFCGAQ